MKNRREVYHFSERVTGIVVAKNCSSKEMMFFFSAKKNQKARRSKNSLIHSFLISASGKVAPLFVFHGLFLVNRPVSIRLVIAGNSIGAVRTILSDCELLTHSL